MGQVLQRGLLQDREPVGAETHIDNELAKVKGFRKVTDGGLVRQCNRLHSILNYFIYLKNKRIKSMCHTCQKQVCLVSLSLRFHGYLYLQGDSEIWLYV